MPTHDHWTAIRELIGSHNQRDAKAGVQVHRFLVDVETEHGRLPALVLLRTAWMALERSLVEAPHANTNEHRAACLAAFDLLQQVAARGGEEANPPLG